MDELTPQDCRNIVALINRAQVTGGEVEEVATLKRKLLDHAKYIEADDERIARISPGGTA